MTALLSSRRKLLAAALACSIAASTLLIAPSAALAYDSPSEVDGMVLDAHGQAIVNDVTTRTIAPGLEQVSFERLETTGRKRVNVLKVALGPGSGVHAGYVGPDAVANTQTLSTMADHAGAIAAINGDQFDINNSGAPLGVTMKDGELLKSGIPLWNRAAVFDKDGLGRVAQLLLTGSASTPQGDFTIQGVNVSEADTGVIALYNANWGGASRGRILFAGETGVEVLVDASGKVTSVSDAPGSGRLADGVQSLVARPGAVADALRKLTVGDSVDIHYSLNKDAENVQTAIGGFISDRPQLVIDGKAGGTMPWDDYANGETFPRTAVGFSHDRATAYLVQVDGRSSTSVGMSFTSLGEMLVDFGAYSAIALDSGGSSQMNVRAPGAGKTSIVNSPSDGTERQTANGIGLFLNAPSSGIAQHIDVETRIAGPDASRVFPGLTRDLTATGVDEAGGPAVVTLDWTADSGSISRTGGGAVFMGGATGATNVVAADGSAQGASVLSVLGPLQRLTASVGIVNLPAKGKTASLSIVGHDAHGFTAPIEPADIQIADLPAHTLDFQPSADGTFTVTALADSAAATPVFTVQGQQVRVPFTVGTKDQQLVDLGESFVADGWTSWTSRATASVSLDAGHEGVQNAARLHYDFSTSSLTRTANIGDSKSGYLMPGQPSAIKVWLKGQSSTGDNPAVYVGFSDADGAYKYVYGKAAPQDWQQVSFPIPAGTKYPITLQMMAAYETAKANQPVGDVWFEGPTASVPQEVEIPEVPVVKDPVIAADGATDSSPLRVAVLSDSQFVARNPNSDIVAQAKRALEEIKAAKPDALIIAGDFVDEASPADFALARKILTDELGGSGLPWYYVPGNHEIMGYPIDNFVAEFGADHQAVDIKSTRFILLDSSDATVTSKLDQVKMLQDQLADAAKNDAITGVVLVQHHPIDDPLPSKASQMGNRLDANLEKQWLEQFRQASGKSAAMITGHVGVFHAKTEDGIPYLINGNSGKNPTDADFGSFTGWSLLGIDPAQGAWASATAPWLQDEVQVRADALTLDQAKVALGATQRHAVKATVSQPDGDVTVAWPMSYAWSGAGVFAGAAKDAPADAIVAVDPSTNVLTALRAGTATAILAMNGVTASTEITVTGGGVAISGIAEQGETLSASTGDWALPGGSEATYAWTRDGASIEGADRAAYTVVPDDAGHTLAVALTVAADGQQIVYRSAPTAVVPYLTLTRTPDPLIEGAARPGTTLTTVAGEWMPAPVDLTYQWSRDGVAVPGATAATYAVSDADTGATLSVAVMGAKPGYTPVVRTSASVAIGEASLPSPSPSDAAGAGVPSGDLAHTGGSFDAVSAVAWTAGVLLLAGGIVVLLARRRSHSRSRS